MGGKKKSLAPTKTYEDDGNLYRVLTHEGRPVYLDTPVVKGRADELVAGLLHGGRIEPVD